jgi:hypothetical protein
MCKQETDQSTNEKQTQLRSNGYFIVGYTSVSLPYSRAFRALSFRISPIILALAILNSVIGAYATLTFLEFLPVGRRKQNSIGHLTKSNEMRTNGSNGIMLNDHLREGSAMGKLQCTPSRQLSRGRK